MDKNEIIIKLEPVTNEDLKRAGFIAYLNVEGQRVGGVNTWCFLKREQLETLYASSHDILGDNPEPKPEVEKVAWPGQSDFRDESRERAEAINAVRMAGLVS